MGRNQYWADRVYNLCVLGSTDSGFMENLGIEPATQSLQGIVFVPRLVLRLVTIFRLYIVKLIKFFELYFSVKYTARLFIYY